MMATINSINDLADYIGVDVRSLKRSMYKYTDCGAWIEWDDESVTIGSIVEGSDAEFSETLRFPFTADDYERWMEELDRLTDETWREANGTIWYAVQTSSTDAWDYGSYDYDEAIEMLNQQGKGLIAIINEDTNFCEGEIRFEDYFEEA